MTRSGLTLVAFLLAGSGAFAGLASAESPTGQGMWSYYTTAYVYLVENDDDFGAVVAWADRGRLHLEARYNYEDFETGSLWAGVNLDGGGSLTWELTLLLGGAFGDTDGIVPGYRGALYWKAIDLSSEGEYLFDSAGHDGNFFYSWSEIAWSRNWFRGGIAMQRTKVYQTDSEVQRGLLAGVFWSAVDAALYWFEPFSGDSAVMILAGIAF